MTTVVSTSLRVQEGPRPSIPKDMLSPCAQYSRHRRCVVHIIEGRPDEDGLSPDWKTELTPAEAVRHNRLTMASVTIRNLRNEFSRVKKVVETEGEVIVTDNGKPRYKLVLYTTALPRMRSRTKDYMTRMRR